MALLVYTSPNASLVRTGEDAKMALSTLKDAPLPELRGERYTKQLPSISSHSSCIGRPCRRPSRSYANLCGCPAIQAKGPRFASLSFLPPWNQLFLDLWSLVPPGEVGVIG